MSVLHSKQIFQYIHADGLAIFLDVAGLFGRTGVILAYGATTGIDTPLRERENILSN